MVIWYNILTLSSCFFPTRRSSDLVDRPRLPVGRRLHPLDQPAYGHGAGLARLGSAQASPVTHLGDVGHRAVVVVQRPDRKSTRLNYSHPSIPYAVFCLIIINLY